MSVRELKLELLDSEHQIALLDQEGVLLESCDSLVELSGALGTSLFEHWAELVGVADSFKELGSHEPELLLPMVQRQDLFGVGPVDLTFRYRGAGQPIALLISRSRASMDRFRSMQQERNHAAIQVQYVREEKAALREENGSLRRYAHVVSHDLKAPMRAVSHLSEWIAEALAKNDTQEALGYVELLKTRTNRMQELVEGILGYSLAGESGAPTSGVDTAKIVADLLQHDYSGSPVKFLVAENLPVIQGAPTALRQVFSNLVSNAVKHGCGKGNAGEDTVTIRVSLEPSHYRFDVCDSGPGIAPGDQARIFEAFQTLSPKEGDASSGLGLCIVSEIVEAAGGEVQVASRPGQGATFSFTWPRDPGADPRDKPDR